MLVTIEGDWLVVRPDPPRACEHVRLAWWLVWLAVSLAMWAGIVMAAWSAAEAAARAGEVAIWSRRAAPIDLAALARQAVEGEPSEERV